MQPSHPKIQVTLEGERVLLPLSFSLLLFSASLPLSVIHHWSALCRVLGVTGLLLSPALLLLSCWEIWRYQHQWRTVLAALISLIATVIGWVSVILHVTGKL